ncbi:hypothetical protein, partial [Paenibacillus whitsoniae]|uniref:hypothetical protein n=1 Tax=Paenibacillus whitsoniae TaxID=2496558 RepID=UPI0019CF787D
KRQEFSAPEGVFRKMPAIQQFFWSNALPMREPRPKCLPFCRHFIKSAGKKGKFLLFCRLTARRSTPSPSYP